MANIMKTDPQKTNQKRIMLIAASVAMVFLLAAAWTVKALISGDHSHRQRQVQMVTLVKPPPPPKIEEKPPEPEEEKEEMVEPEPEEAPQEMDDATQDEAPAGDDLGLDADGTAGADAFGLMGKKGGRSLIGGSGDRTLMQRYGWYTRMIQDEIRKKINDYMANNGGIPQGEHKAMVYIVLDAEGRIVDFELRQGSGNAHMDQALKETLAGIRMAEAPPEGMPRSLRLRVSSKG